MKPEPAITGQRPADLVSRHDIDRPEDRDAIAADMAQNGWQGMPLVIDSGNANGLLLITGHHRATAAVLAGLETVPCVDIAGLCEQAGVNPEDFNYGDGYGIMWDDLLGALPASVRDAYGINW